MVVKALTQLDRFLDAMTARMTPDVAREMVDFQFDLATRERLEELAGKANSGLLSEEEREEYAQYIEVGDLIGVLQSRARRVLERKSA